MFISSYRCDLAGSERIKRTGASGDRLSEAQHINSSLLELGQVFLFLFVTGFGNVFRLLVAMRFSSYMGDELYSIFDLIHI